MQILDFTPAFADAFRALNTAWITRYFALEPRDVAVLNDPQGQIIDRGGHVLMAVEDGEAVGCCALFAQADGGFELAKMAVDPGHQGKGLGRALLLAAIDRAKAANAPRIWLEANSVLAPALSLYRSLGFKPTDRPMATGSGRGEIQMELQLG